MPGECHIKEFSAWGVAGLYLLGNTSICHCLIGDFGVHVDEGFRRVDSVQGWGDIGGSYHGVIDVSKEFPSGQKEQFELVRVCEDAGNGVVRGEPGEGCHHQAEDHVLKRSFGRLVGKYYALSGEASSDHFANFDLSELVPAFTCLREESRRIFSVGGIMSYPCNESDVLWELFWCDELFRWVGLKSTNWMGITFVPSWLGFSVDQVMVGYRFLDGAWGGVFQDA